MKHNTNKSWGQVEDKMRRWGYFWLHWWNNKGDLPLSSRPPNGGNSTAKIRTSQRTTKQRSSFPANWKRKGDTKRRQGTPPPCRSRKHHIHLSPKFFNFQFSDLPPSAHQPSAHQPPTEAIKTSVFTSITAQWTIMPPTAEQRLKRKIWALFGTMPHDQDHLKQFFTEKRLFSRLLIAWIYVFT